MLQSFFLDEQKQMHRFSITNFNTSLLSLKKKEKETTIKSEISTNNRFKKKNKTKQKKGGKKRVYFQF